MEIFVALAATVNRLVELWKRYLKERTMLDENARRLLTFLGQLVIGVITAFIAQAQADILTGTPFAKLDAFYGTFLAGLALGLGAEAWMYVFDIFGKLSKK